MEIASGIHRIETRIGDRINALHLFVGTQATLLVDTGLAEVPEQVLAPYLTSIGVNIEELTYVLITHADFDHMGGNASLRSLAPHAKFLCHARDQAHIEDIEQMIIERYGEFHADHSFDETEESKTWIREIARGTPIDIVLTGGEQIHLGDGWTLEILHTPGHSPGHLSIYDPRSATLLIADAALGHGLLTHDGQPAFPPTYRSVESYLSTIQRLQAIPVSLLLTSHYPPLMGPASDAFLADSRGYIDRIDGALRQALQAAPAGRTTRQLIGELAARLGDWSDASLLVYPFTGHLERFVQYSLVELDQIPGASVWRWKK